MSEAGKHVANEWPRTFNMDMRVPIPQDLTGWDASVDMK